MKTVLTNLLFQEGIEKASLLVISESRGMLEERKVPGDREQVGH